jgi:hypothetical protein
LFKKDKFWFFLILLLSVSFSSAQEEGKKYNFEFEFDPYYSDVAFYLSLTQRPVPFLGEENELAIYKNLLYDSPLPRFFLLELSAYPLPCLGVYLKKNHRQFYDSANIGEDANLIQSICSGFEEPYAVSIFLGNLVSFKPRSSPLGEGELKSIPRQTQDYEGKGYSGYLFSVGNYHIKDSELIKDNWYELEWKVKGDRISPDRKMSWSFRIGAILHEHPGIKDVIYFSLRRDRIDYQTRELSFFKNTEFEYRFDVNKQNWKIIRHFFLAGKSFPLGSPVAKKKLVFKLRLGFLWEGEEKYTGSLARVKKEDYFQFLFRPNVEF